jgi:zinc protease
MRAAVALFGAVILLATRMPVGAHPLEHTRQTLPNGAVLLVSEQRNVPMVVIRFLLDAGSRRDPAGKEGLANLTADLLTEGTRKRSATQISDAVDFLGASLDSGAGVDTAHLNLTVLSKDLATGLSLLGEVLLQPAFPSAEIERRREAVLAAMKASEDQPGHVASRVFTEFLFRGEPYGHLAQGTPDGVKAITRQDVLDFYQRHYRPERAIVTVVGDVSAADAAASFEKALSAWQAGSAGEFEYPAKAESAAEVIKVRKPVTQANIVLGHRGVARANPDYYALEVMNFMLGGGGFGSRLLDNIRTRAGLAYSVGSGFSAPKFPGSFRIVLQTKNETAAQAVALACAEIERIRREPVTDEELSSAQLYLTGSFPLQLDSNSEIASFLTEVEFFDLGADYADTYPERIKAVTKDDVMRAASKYLQPDNLSLVVVADLDQARIGESPPCRASAPAAAP